MKQLSRMTEEELKTLCNSLKNEYVSKSTVTLKQSDFDNMWKTIDKQSEKIERLQEQLKEANEVISTYRIYDDTEAGKATEYCKKWGVE